jgi:hypothetical protein
MCHYGINPLETKGRCANGQASLDPGDVGQDAADYCEQIG